VVSKPKRKPGRPSKGKRGTFTFRVTETLRDRLESAAAEAGRSVSEEIERLLDHSIAQEQLLGDRATGELVRRVITSIEVIRSLTGRSWNSDERASRALATSFTYMTKWMSETNKPKMTVGSFVDLARRLDSLDAEELGLLIAELLSSPTPLLSTAVVSRLQDFQKNQEGSRT
jgi:Arc-like DNA binding domain